MHVTLRVAPGVWNLRSQRSWSVIERALFLAFCQGNDRFGVRLNRFSVQGNHIHLLVEARDHLCLGRAVKGISVRLARGLNKMMCRRGRVLGDRYHARRLRTPSEVRGVIDYIRENRRRHAEAYGEVLSPGYVDPYSSDGAPLGLVLPEPATWLLQTGWQRGRPPRES